MRRVLVNEYTDEQGRVHRSVGLPLKGGVTREISEKFTEHAIAGLMLHGLVRAREMIERNDGYLAEIP